LNLPNALTLSRIFIVPLLVVVLLTPLSNRIGVPQHILGVLIFTAAALTDFLMAGLREAENRFRSSESYLIRLPTSS
jgi:hypothetical protein